MMASNCGGYDYHFVNESPQEILVCKICLLVSRDPYLSVCCGHVFCKSCIDKTKQNTAIIQACPVCRSKEFTTVVNKQVERLVKNLSVFCTNKEKGCKWEGELNDIDSHLTSTNGCKYADVQCTNECGKVVQRRYLKHHLDCACSYNKTNCKYCNARIEQKLINSKHKEECPKFPLLCPNKCKIGSIPRENLQKHLSDECMLQNVKCSNKCGIILQRQFLNYHLKSECPCRKVKCQYCHAYNTHKFIEGQHKTVCPRFPVLCSNRCGATIPRKDVDEHKNVCSLENIQCMYHALGCCDIILRINQKRHNEESVEKHLQLVVSELNSTKQKLTTTDQMLSLATDKLVGVQMELNDTRKDLTCARKETASMKQSLISTQMELKATRKDLTYAREETVDVKQTLISAQMELNSTKTDLTNADRALARSQRHFSTAINERQNQIEEDLFNVKRDITGDLSDTLAKVNALEIVTHQIAKLKLYFTLFSNKITSAANQSVYQAAMIKLFESENQTCPVYIKKEKIGRLRKNREIWNSNPFFLTMPYRVHLCIDASECAYGQDPLLQLHITNGPSSTHPLKGRLKLLLLNHIANSDDQIEVFNRGCEIVHGQNPISMGTLPINTLQRKYLKDDSVIILVSFNQSTLPLILLIIFTIVMIVATFAHSVLKTQ